MKYIIDIPKEYESDWVNKSSRLGFELCFPINETANNKKYYIPTGLKLEPYTEPDRKAIEDEVWEFVRELIHCNNGKGMVDDELQSCFGHDLYSQVFKHLSYQEAKAKYDEWKRKKEGIHVGDEVISTFGDKMVVTHHWNQNDGTTGVSGFSADCSGLYYDEIEVEKTGRHFPEVEELLKKLVGEQE